MKIFCSVCLFAFLMLGNPFEFWQTGPACQDEKTLQNEPDRIREIRMGKDSPPEYAITDEDSDIVRLKKERINFLYAARNWLLLSYQEGNVPLGTVLNNEILLSEARIDFHQDPQHTVAILEDQLKSCKQAETLVHVHFEGGETTIAEVCLSGYYRASCELRLKKLTSGTPK